MRMMAKWATIALALAIPANLPAQVTAPAAQAPVAVEKSRFIIIDGGRNLRDVGGYLTEKGKQVRWGRLYRAGSLGGLTDTGRQTFEQLNTGAIIDLRSTSERAGDRGDWLKARPGYWTRDYDLGFGNLSKIFADPTKVTPDVVRSFMAEGYRKTIDEQATSYRQLFLQLASAKKPVVVNCTAGKDRTGVATALVLRSVGVPYASVRQDFLLSNNAPGMDSLRQSMGKQAAGMGGGMSPEVMGLLSGVDGAYLDAAFDQIEKDYGSLDGYLKRKLGLKSSQLAAVRRNLTR